MTSQLLTGLAIVALLGSGRLLQAQDAPEKAQVDIARVRSVPQIYVGIDVRTGADQLFVPYCGRTEGGDEILCTLGVHLEVQGQQGWHPAKLRTTYGVLGASSWVERVGG